MGWFIWIGLLVLLLISYIDLRKNLDLRAWLLIIGVFMLCNFFVNLFGLLIPAGFIIGLIYMNKTKKFYLAKAHIFGLICVIATFYTPKFGLNEINAYVQNSKYTSEFNQVNAVYHFNPNSEINKINLRAAEIIKEKNPKSAITIDPNVLFRIWVLSHKNLQIQDQDLDWLYYKSPQEYHYYWSSTHPNELNSMEHIIFNGVGYLGVFQRADINSAFSLQAIYEFDHLKMGNPLIP
jgi:hypothetical protein